MNDEFLLLENQDTYGLWLRGVRGPVSLPLLHLQKRIDPDLTFEEVFDESYLVYQVWTCQ